MGNKKHRSSEKTVNISFIFMSISLNPTIHPITCGSYLFKKFNDLLSQAIESLMKTDAALLMHGGDTKEIKS